VIKVEPLKLSVAATPVIAARVKIKRYFFFLVAFFFIAAFVAFFEACFAAGIGTSLPK